ncbi:MAG TPA: GNAT family N-acetyltransferase [Thermoleophilaceae bacterium]
MAELTVRLSEDADRARVEAFLSERGHRHAARLGSLEDPLAHPALIALRGDELAGVLTFVVDGDSCEVLTLNAGERRRGVGTALIEAVEREAAEAGCERLWLITTNDNVDALRFYQRRGFRLVKLHVGAVDDSRARLKPEIPRVGEHGIDLRDELELEKLVGA